MRGNDNAGAKAADHLDFAEGLLDLFDASDRRRGDYLERIARVRARLGDDRFYLAVIGEFSSGKSTFINALLDAEIFAASALVTTSASVRVRYGPAFGVRAVFGDGSVWERTAGAGEHLDGARGPVKPADGGFDGEPTTRQVREHLERTGVLEALTILTTDPGVAPQVERVDVTYPSALLETGLVVIDTPGTNSGDGEHGHAHAAIARQVVTEADLAVVVSAESKIMTLSLQDFLTGALDEGLLARCCFVITYADQIEPDEFDDRRRDAARRIAGPLSLTDPPIIFASPKQVVAARRGTLPEDGAVWVERFGATRRWLHRIAALRRPAAVADTALRLLQELLDQLDRELEGEMRTLEKRQHELDAVAPADMEDFLADRLTAGVRSIRRAEKRALTRVGDLTDSATDGTESAIRAAIAPCGNGKAIENVVRNEVPSLVRDRLNTLAEGSATAVTEILRRELTTQAEALRAAFTAEYSKLERIDAAPLTGDTAHVGLAGIVVGADTFSAAAAIGADDSTRDALSFGGGVGAGALLGTMILPGIGTVVGGALGFVVGALFAADITKVRARATEKATAPVRPVFLEAGRQLKDAVAGSADGCEKELRRQAAWYRRTYSKTIDALHQEHHRRQKSLNSRRDRVRAAQKESAARGRSVTAERVRLRTVDRLNTTDPFGGWND
ncbi:hypothetical protein GCM10009677_11700 [Sphaerisporangium rubeum]|uniref:Gas vesicle protein/GTPase SAR1 family protein n=1 Tax=Sphaerisporangium rubeum TaxID=321317 RepID=A0A7X0IBU7_9ACTN|nr:dynamin family protein [Sphaerisporangium rubeum]MBB6472210.1 gas vesicle protein/GTPase SAR1 family protein [Sphaerisporangium rubeum]